MRPRTGSSIFRLSASDRGRSQPSFHKRNSVSTRSRTISKIRICSSVGTCFSTVRMKFVFPHRHCVSKDSMYARPFTSRICQALIKTRCLALSCYINLCYFSSFCINVRTYFSRLEDVLGIPLTQVHEPLVNATSILVESKPCVWLCACLKWCWPLLLCFPQSIEFFVDCLAIRERCVVISSLHDAIFHVIRQRCTLPHVAAQSGSTSSGGQSQVCHHPHHLPTYRQLCVAPGSYFQCCLVRQDPRHLLRRCSSYRRRPYPPLVSQLHVLLSTRACSICNPDLV